MVFLYIPGKGEVVDVGNLERLDIEGRNQLCNGDFQAGGKCHKSLVRQAAENIPTTSTLAGEARRLPRQPARAGRYRAMRVKAANATNSIQPCSVQRMYALHRARWRQPKARPDWAWHVWID